MSLTSGDERLMRRALRLAERGRPTVSPNPLVGCVLARDGTVVGEGFHERPGGPHAEAVALAAAGERARGATAYVTLEPCDHSGRTPPCSQALLRAGVTRVVAAVADPHPRAAGGAARLRAAGVAVELGLCADLARRQNEVFLHGLAAGRPFVIAKAAVSLDGRIAAADGSARWLTGADARRAAHELRAQVDAVVIGSGTLLADDPRLTCRLPGYRGRQPLRVVLDRHARTTARHRVAAGDAPSLVLVGPDAELARVAALQAAAVQVETVPVAPGGGLELHAVLRGLWRRGVRAALVEGGARVTTSFLRERLCDKLIVHLAPLLLGEGGRPLLVGDGIATLERAPRLRLDRVERAGDDALLTLYPPAAGSEARTEVG